MPQVASDHLGPQDLLDMMSFVEGAVRNKMQDRRMPQLQKLCHLRAQVRSRPIEPLKHGLKLLPTQGHGKCSGILEVRTDPDFRHGDGGTRERRVSQFPPHQDPGEDMPYLLTNPQLPLAGSAAG